MHARSCKQALRCMQTSCKHARTHTRMQHENECTWVRHHDAVRARNPLTCKHASWPPQCKHNRMRARSFNGCGNMALSTAAGEEPSSLEFVACPLSVHECEQTHFISAHSGFHAPCCVPLCYHAGCQERMRMVRGLLDICSVNSPVARIL